MIYQTSIENFWELKDDFKNDEEKVYFMIKAAPSGITTKDLAAWMGRTPNQISGRITSLKKKGRVKVLRIQTRDYNNGRTVKKVKESVYVVKQ